MGYKPFLSKSKYLEGLKCLKLIWYRYNAKDEIPELDDQTVATFNYGHWIGEKAKQAFPNGIEDRSEMSFGQHLERSKELLSLRRPIFEGGYMYDSAYARADVLDPVGDYAWDIIEVKAGRSVHDVNCHDVSFQRYCYQNAGLTINRCYVMHVKPGVQVKGPTPVEEAFEKVDITETVERYSDGIEDRIADIRVAMSAAECPAVCLGDQCEKPYGCIMRSLCQKHSA